MKADALKISSRESLAFIFVTYAVVLSPLVDAELRNYLVLFGGMLGGVAVFAFNIRIARSFLLVALMCSYMGLVVLTTDTLDRLGSVALTAVYASGLLASAGLIDRLPDKRAFTEALFRWIIYAFAIVSFVQMLTSLSGLPVPNLIGTKGLWSYNSLSFEPSQLGRVIGITMLAYLIVTRPAGQSELLLKLFTRRWMVFLAFLVTMLLSGSALAVMAIALVIIMSRSLRMAVVLLAFVFIAWPAIVLIDYEPFRRSVMLLSNLHLMDVTALLRAEGSGAVRIIPSLIYLRDASPNELGFWFGYGTEGLARYFQYRIPGLGDNVAAGFLPGFAVVYGIVGAALFVWIFLLRYLNATTAPLVIFWLIFLSTSAWNAQVLWYGLIVIQIVHSVHRSLATERASNVA